TGGARLRAARQSLAQRHRRPGTGIPARTAVALRALPLRRRGGCRGDGGARASRGAPGGRAGTGGAKRRRPRRLTSAPASIDTVAAFRPWRGFRPSVARGRRGHHWDVLLEAMAERGGFEPPKRGLDAYTLSRRAPSTTRTPLRWTGNSTGSCHTGPCPISS